MLQSPALLLSLLNVTTLSWAMINSRTRSTTEMCHWRSADSIVRLPLNRVSLRLVSVLPTGLNPATGSALQNDRMALVWHATVLILG